MGNILKIFRNKKYDVWKVCKSCGGEVTFSMPKFYEEMLQGKMGTLKCKNCGKEIIV